MKKFSWIDLVIVLSFLLLVYLILTRIFGNSASDLEIIVGLLTFLGSLSMKSITLAYNLNREFGEFKVKTVYNFDSIKEGLKKVKEDTTLIKNDLNLIKNKLKINK